MQHFKANIKVKIINYCIVHIFVYQNQIYLHLNTMKRQTNIMKLFKNLPPSPQIKLNRSFVFSLQANCFAVLATYNFITKVIPRINYNSE